MRDETYLGRIEVPEGYNGHTAILHLSQSVTGDVHCVHQFGHYTVPAACWPTSRERAALRALHRAGVTS